MHPTTGKLGELVYFKVVTIEDPPTIFQQLKDELSLFLSLATDINKLHFDMERILHFFKSHSHEIPSWAQLASLLAT